MAAAVAFSQHQVKHLLDHGARSNDMHVLRLLLGVLHDPGAGAGGHLGSDDVDGGVWPLELFEEALNSDGGLVVAKGGVLVEGDLVGSHSLSGSCKRWFKLCKLRI